MRPALESCGAFLAVLATALAVAAIAAEPDGARPAARVVFVCEHGNVKSLIASQWFNRLAAGRGLTVRGVARGLSPEPAVPAAIADRLRDDGFDVRGFRPSVLAAADLAGASRLVMIGAEPPAWLSGTDVAVDRWEGIPPASERYPASRDALRDRVAGLVESLGAEPSAR